MSTPFVSVVIPTHGRHALLREALDSIAAQTLRDFEVIVVDDASPKPVEPALAGHPVRPRVCRLATQSGPAAARNVGIREATADLVAFLDSDDLWTPTKLERFAAALEAEPGVRIFYGPMDPIDANGRTVPGRTKPCFAGRITRALFRSSFVHVPTVMCHKTVLTAAGGFDESLPVCEDYDLWLRVSVTEPFGLVAPALAQRRLHSSRLSKDQMSRNLAVKALVLRRFAESAGAGEWLDPRLTAGRLGRACFVAARAYFREGRYREAGELCRMSRGYGGWELRTLPLALRSWLRAGKSPSVAGGSAKWGWPEVASSPPLAWELPKGAALAEARGRKKAVSYQLSAISQK